MTTIHYPHLEQGESGEPGIAGANTRVLDIALDRLAYHWDANEIQRQRPHLTLGQIYSALAYYHDHESEMNARISEVLQREDRLLAALPASRVRTRLQAAKRAL